MFDEWKTHLLAGCDPTVRSRTPRGVVQEVYGLALAHGVVRRVMAAAAEGRARTRTACPSWTRCGWCSAGSRRRPRSRRGCGMPACSGRWGSNGYGHDASGGTRG